MAGAGFLFILAAISESRTGELLPESAMAIFSRIIFAAVNGVLVER